ncbi:MAG: hypothetical protein K1X57_00310 [Gemmataceae bacterium]|nr:hypothetical protein [Gemmataceae bacterium]
MVLDVDDAAATWSLIADDSRQLRLIGAVSIPQFGRLAWIDRLMDAAADQCIRVCRRDPRDSAVAEQALDDQVVEYLEKDRDGRPLSLDVRTEHWFQNIVFTPDEVERACAGPIRTVVDAVRPLLESSTTPPEALLVTASAARLPGLMATFGVRLPERTAIEELPASAPGEAAYGLAIRRSRGELPAGHLDSVLPRIEPAAERARV